MSPRIKAACATVTVIVCAWVGFASTRVRLDHPTPTVVMSDREGRFLAELEVGDSEGSGYWPIEPLPWRVVACTVALEDARFADHPGVDPIGVGRAIAQNAQAGHLVSGASTIAMQVARMQDPGPRTLENKALEATVALLLVGRYGRDAVLAQYLTLAPYGNGTHGIAFAAWRYFDKPVSDLSWAETAVLVALPQSPSRMDLYDPVGRERAIARGSRVLDLALEQGLLDPAEYTLAVAQLPAVWPVPRRARPAEAMHVILDEEARIESSEGPLPQHVRSALDLELQEVVYLAVREEVKSLDEQGANNGAAMVLDVRTGEVLASVGSTDYFDRARSGAIDYTSIRRSPGSALKPFLYAKALDEDVLAPNTILDDLARAHDGTGNADDRFLGPLLPRLALGNSRNVPAASLVEQLGVDESYATYRDLGLTSGTGRARGYGLGLAVGAMPVTMRDLAGAYLTLAGDGRSRAPVWQAGEVAAAGRRVFTEDAALTVTSWLSDPLARMPSFPRRGALEYPFPVAVKTGTSEDSRDAWVAAWSERYLVLAWVGDPHHQAMVDVSGASSAARIARDVLLALHGHDADGMADHGFPPPSGEVVQVCALTGARATKACDHVVSERLDADHLPERCTAHQHVIVDGQRRTFVDLGPKYAAWQARSGLERPPGVAPIDVSSVVAVATPRRGDHFVRDPAVPVSAATIGLSVTVDPPVPQVVWYVDGEPYATVDYPYETRWTLVPGEHRFEARVPFTEISSRSVRVTVQ